MFTCNHCQQPSTKLHWLKDRDGWCPSCFHGAEAPSGLAPAVHGDEIDVWIKHGICNEDGTPRRYRSKEEMRRVTFERGLFQGGDTPKVNQRIREERLKNGFGR